MKSATINKGVVIIGHFAMPTTIYDYAKWKVKVLESSRPVLEPVITPPRLGRGGFTTGGGEDCSTARNGDRTSIAKLSAEVAAV